MDRGSQNQEQVANNHFECEPFLASSVACIWPAAPPQTSGMRDVLPLSAMISSWLTSTWAHALIISLLLMAIQSA